MIIGRRERALIGRYLGAAPQLAGASEILLFSSVRPIRLANALSKRLPTARIHVFGGEPFDAATMVKPASNVNYVYCSTAEARAEYLTKLPPIGAVLDVDDDVRVAQRRFQRLFWFVEPGGPYLLDCRCAAGCHTPYTLRLERTDDEDPAPGLSD